MSSWAHKIGIKITKVPDGTSFGIDDKGNFYIRGIPRDAKGVNYPSNWIVNATPAEREDLGFVPIIYGDRGDEKFYTIVEGEMLWDTNSKVVRINYSVTEKSAPAELAVISDREIETVKAEAYRRIVAISPEYKQRNLLARGLELALKMIAGGTLTAGEQAEITAGRQIWARIKAIREHSDMIEVEIAAKNFDDLKKYKAESIEWPQ